MKPTLWVGYDEPRLHDQLERHEGRRYRAYLDTTGHVTIGIGRNLSERGVNDEEIERMYERDVCEAVEDLRAHLPWFERLGDVQQRVLIDMTFNMGIDGVLGFHRTLAAMEDGRAEDAARFMLQSLWANQVGDGPGGRMDRAERLATMWRTGKDTP